MSRGSRTSRSLAGRLALWAAIAACVAWALKALAIWNAGGLDESALEGPLFILGLLCVVVAFAAFGVALAGPRGLAWQVAGGVAGALVGLAWVVAIESVVGALVPESAGWVKEEAGLWVAALLAAALMVARRAGGVTPPAPRD